MTGEPNAIIQWLAAHYPGPTHPLWGIFIFIFGATWGSFLNVCIWRMPRDQSVVRPRSHCGNCNRLIPWYDNLPLISYFALGGRCRNCGAPFSFRYWLVEFMNAALWLLMWREFVADRGWIVVLAYCVMISMLIIGTFIDFEFYIIPNRITLGLVVVGFAFSMVEPGLHPRPSWVTTWLPKISPWQHSLLQSVLGIAVGWASVQSIVLLGKLAFGRYKMQFAKPTTIIITKNKLKLPDEEVSFDEIFFRSWDRVRFRAAKIKFKDKSFKDADVIVSETAIWINGQKYLLSETGRIEAVTELLIIPREAMGLGDVKLMAGIGAFIGATGVLFTLMISALVGSVVGVVLVILRLRELQGKIPYGPYIALAAVIWLFFGQDVIDWYFGMFAQS